MLCSKGCVWDANQFPLPWVLLFRQAKPSVKTGRWSLPWEKQQGVSGVMYSRRLSRGGVLIMPRNHLPQKRRKKEETFPRRLRGIVWRLYSASGHQMLLEWSTRPVMKTTRYRETRELIPLLLFSFSSCRPDILLFNFFLCLGINILRKHGLRDNTSEDAYSKKKSGSAQPRLSSHTSLRISRLSF